MSEHGEQDLEAPIADSSVELALDPAPPAAQPFDHDEARCLLSTNPYNEKYENR
jgi:hypothetical protein